MKKSFILLTGFIFLSCSSPIQPYYDKEYMVSDKCTMNVAKILTKEAGIYFSSEELTLLKAKINRLVHSKPSKNWRDTMDFSKKNPENFAGDDKFSYAIAQSENNLELILVKHDKAMKFEREFTISGGGKVIESGWIKTNSISGLEKYILEDCSIK